MARGRAGTRNEGNKVATKVPTAAERRATFLAVLARTANVSRAARAAGIASSTLYGMRSRSAAFAREWDAAIAEALDTLEETLIQRALHGVEKPVFYGGEQRGSVRVYSDQLAMFLLRARRPEVYDRVVKAAQTPDEMSEEEARAEYERRLRRIRGEEEGA